MINIDLYSDDLVCVTGHLFVHLYKNAVNFWYIFQFELFYF